ncbi:MAG: hypothetical protein JRJ02_06725, partial [Deltaproteobacteria bacterium]|nr:hypothetical protein [Deltaproteobacteria bacterium]
MESISKKERGGDIRLSSVRVCFLATNLCFIYLSKKRRNDLAGALAVAMLFGFAEKSNAMELADGKITINGFLKNWTGYRFGFYSHERDSGLSIMRTVLQLEAEVKLNEVASLVGIFRIAREPEYNLEDDAKDLGLFDGDEMDEEVMRELYLAWQPTENFWTAVGKQQVAWGDLAGIGLRVMDNINALDVRWHYALDNFEDVRKPLIMLNSIYSIPSIEGNLQLVWVPGLEDTWERVTSIYITPAHRYGLNNLFGGAFGGGDKPGDFPPIGAFEPPTSGNVNGITRKISDSSIGMRFQKTSGGLTWAISDYYTFDQNPDLNGNYNRLNIFGITGNWYDQYTDGVWLFEAGYFHDQSYGGNDGTLKQEDTYKWGLRYDRRTFFYWLPAGDRRSLLSGFQVIQTVIPDNDDFDNQNDTGVGGETTDTVGTLYLNFGVANDRVQFFWNTNWWFEREFGVGLFFVEWRP